MAIIGTVPPVDPSGATPPFCACEGNSRSELTEQHSKEIRFPYSLDRYSRWIASRSIAEFAAKGGGLIARRVPVHAVLGRLRLPALRSARWSRAERAADRRPLIPP